MTRSAEQKGELSVAGALKENGAMEVREQGVAAEWTS